MIARGAIFRSRRGEWLRRYYSAQNRRGNTAATRVIADQDYRVAAYATLSMTACGTRGGRRHRLA
jgi:hypothetical protein